MFQVLVTDPLSTLGLAQLEAESDIEVIQKINPTTAELYTAIQTADALLVRSQTQVTAKILDAAPRLKAIGRAGVGVDNIDVQAATEHGVIVLNAPDGNTISTAEHAFALLISLARNIPQAHAFTQAGMWERKRFLGTECRGKVLGIIGMGRVGSELAKRALAFQMDVIAFDPYLTTERARKLNINKLSFTDVIQQADFITVHTPLTKATHHLINREALAQMKEGVRIINCARGGIVDENALEEALASGKVAGVALDVYEVEPPGRHPLFHYPQVIATPHLGASTTEAQESVAIDVCRELIHILRDQPFRNAVNLPSLPPEVREKIRPYQQLAEKMGKLAALTCIGAPARITLSYAGELAEWDTSYLTRLALKGALSPHLSGINNVNAPYIAEQRGIIITEQRSSKQHGFTNQLTVSIESEHHHRTIAGTLLNGLGPRCTQIDGYAIDLIPEGDILLIHHHDRPGAIGRVGSLLGDLEINIATMQVGRKDRGGNAIMLLTMDRPLQPEGIGSLEALDEIQSVLQFEL
ncbi:phosphoglycerate dehydrogenase [Mechercharimyces sp. CAU 1602]|uniref:phosphoglycerate dehydrogenase n=1 Tax=Mechercharimyces sp. CAU 1602 TaxID=2973933 RepID=UPI0021633588|nr:phosphoglycerate dehydrogenase [Mechercharimyces sp. CAU 1602]MCS1350946.1 phosphoglycerate dehydrogenase [Mechercharimyces sp. CAU 1602]